MTNPAIVTQINEVRDAVVRMASLTSRQLCRATAALLQREAAAADEVEALDHEIDRRVAEITYAVE